MNDREFEQLLLRSAREDAPPGDGQAAWARLAAGLGAIASRSAPAGDRGRPETAAAAALARRPAAAAKWLLLGAIGGSALTAAVMLRLGARPSSAPARVAAPGRAAPGPEAPAFQPARVAAAPEAPLPAAPPKHARRGHARALAQATGGAVSGAASRSDLAAEVARIDAARTASAAGNHDEAIWLIERYHGDFPDGALAPDADVVALEALAAKGDRPETTRRAILFLSRYPDDPHAARVKWLADHLGSEAR